MSATYTLVCLMLFTLGLITVSAARPERAGAQVWTLDSWSAPDVGAQERAVRKS